MVQTIYFDESGFTGNNLLDGNQPIFSLGSVALSAEESTEIAADATQRFGLRAAELKGSKLLSTPRGRDAVIHILKELGARKRFLLINKRFAASCKIFEYLIEPAISDCSSFFYGQNLHYFFSDALLSECTEKDADAIFAGLTLSLRQRDPAALQKSLAEIGDKGKPLLQLMSRHSKNNWTEIENEINTVQKIDVAKWLLDLSATSVHGLLTTWAERFEVIEAICDESKPLADWAPSWNSRVGKPREKYYLPNGEAKWLFSLSRPVQFAKSHEVAGLQLADIVAATGNHLLQNRYSDFFQQAYALVEDSLDPNSMMQGSRSFSRAQSQHLSDLLQLIALSQEEQLTPCEKVKRLFLK